MSETPSFSLIHDPWVECVMKDGSTSTLSLTEIFTHPADIAEVRGDSPTQDYAVLRVLLAISWRAHATNIDISPGTTFDYLDWFDERWESAKKQLADDIVLAYLNRFTERFDLRHPATPFMQVADLHTASGNTLRVSRMIPEAEHSYFTLRAGEPRESISAAEAARWVIHTHAFDYSGIKSGAVGDPRVKGGRGYPIGQGWSGLTGGTTIIGQSLAETLVLNTPPEVFENQGIDLPPWEREPDTAAPRAASFPTGPIDLATWQSRRIRLHWDGDAVTSVLVSNGDQIPEAGANVLADPMTPDRKSVV